MHNVTTLHAYAGIFPPDAPEPTVADLTPLWQGRVDASLESTQRVHVLVAEEPDAGIVGIAAFERLDESPLDASRDVVLLHSFHVLPTHWDRGLGAALHGDVVAAAASWHSGTIDVLVLEGNTRGRAWYLRHGYQPTGVRLPAFGDLDLHDEGLRLTTPFA